MRKFLVPLFAALAFLASASAARAQVPPTPVGWSVAPVDGPSVLNTGTTNASSPPGTSSIDVQGTGGGGKDNSGIIIYKLTAHSSQTSPFSDSFDGNSGAVFNFHVVLTDLASGEFKPFDLSAKFWATGVTEASLLPGKIEFDTTPVSQTIGGHNYSIALSSITLPGSPLGDQGRVLAVVTVGPPDGSGQPPGDTPEPTSLLLAGFGIPALIAIRRRLKKVQD